MVSRERQFQSRTKSILHQISLVSRLVVSCLDKSANKSALISKRQLKGKVLVMLIDCHLFKSHKAESTYSTEPVS